MVDATRFTFEAVKMQMSQSKDGWALALRLHPDDLTMELMKLPVGQRVGVALIPIADDDGAFENKERMAKLEREEREEAANKRRYNQLMDGVLSSPYVDMWAEEEGIMNQNHVLSKRQFIESKVSGENWLSKYESLSEIANQIRGYM